MSEWNLAHMIAHLQPRIIVELGTGDGATAANIMLSLPDGASLTTINWPNPPSGDNPHRYLAPWIGDPRLMLLFGDTRDPQVAARVPNNIGLLHIDSTHTRECAEAEWKLYEPKLAKVSVVVVDDLDHNDMMEFWDSLPSDRTIVRDGRVGIMRHQKR